MKCLTRPHICPTAAFASVGTTGLARPLHRHHLVRPWYPRVPGKCPSQFTCKCSRGTGSTPSGFCTIFLLIGCAARNQLPHDVEGKGSWILSRGAGVAVVPLRGPERWGFELSMWIDKLSWALANQSPLPPRTLVEVCMKGPSFVGIFFICVGERPRPAASHPRRKEGRGVSFNDMQVDWLDQIT